MNDASFTRLKSVLIHLVARRDYTVALLVRLCMTGMPLKTAVSVRIIDVQYYNLNLKKTICGVDVKLIDCLFKTEEHKFDGILKLYSQMSHRMPVDENLLTGRSFSEAALFPSAKGGGPITTSHAQRMLRAALDGTDYEGISFRAIINAGRRIDVNKMKKHKVSEQRKIFNKYFNDNLPKEKSVRPTGPWTVESGTKEQKTGVVTPADGDIPANTEGVSEQEQNCLEASASPPTRLVDDAEIVKISLEVTDFLKRLKLKDDEVSDCCNETMVKLCETIEYAEPHIVAMLEGPDSEKTLMAYACGIARNTCSKYISNKMKYTTITNMDNFFWESLVERTDKRSASMSSDDRKIQSVADLISRLSPSEKMILTELYGLDYKGERTYEEVARAFGGMTGNTMGIEKGAIKKLKAIVAKLYKHQNDVKFFEKNSEFASLKETLPKRRRRK